FIEVEAARGRDVFVLLELSCRHGRAQISRSRLGPSGILLHEQVLGVFFGTVPATPTLLAVVMKEHAVVVGNADVPRVALAQGRVPTLGRAPANSSAGVRRGGRSRSAVRARAIARSRTATGSRSVAARGRISSCARAADSRTTLSTRAHGLLLVLLTARKAQHQDEPKA